MGQKRKRNVDLPPVYELNLNGFEDHESAKVVDIFVNPADTLVLRCSAGEGIDPKHSVELRREDASLIDVSRDKRNQRVSLFINSFDRSEHGHVFECTATRVDGLPHSRKLKLIERIQLPPGAKECSTKRTMCYNYGVCIEAASGVQNCICPPDFGGKYCGDPVVSDFVVEAAKVAMGCGTVVYAALILLTVFFAFLFVKQNYRKKRRALMDKIANMELASPGNDHLEHADPTNPYQDCSFLNKSSTKKHQIFNCEIVREIEPMSCTMSIKKFRKTIRARLPGTSDSKCFIDSEQSQPARFLKNIES